MANDFAAALAEEIGGLERELERDPRYAKLRELRRVQALYAAPVAAVLPPVVLPANEPRARTSGGAGRSPSPETQKILGHVAGLIRGRTQPTSTSDIYQMLETIGTEVPGASPRNNLSAMLSNAKAMFKTHGRTGWTLIEETPEASDDLLARSASEASTSSPASPAGEPPSVRPVDPVPGGGA